MFLALAKSLTDFLQMYVTLYNGHVHPGVNMLLGMGKLVGAQDPVAVAVAGNQIQEWAQAANNQIVQLIAQVCLSHNPRFERCELIRLPPCRKCGRLRKKSRSGWASSRSRSARSYHGPPRSSRS